MKFKFKKLSGDGPIEFIGYDNGLAFCSIDDFRGTPIGNWRLEIGGQPNTYYTSLNLAKRAALKIICLQAPQT